jgi:hypothetical protein
MSFQVTPPFRSPPRHPQPGSFRPLQCHPEPRVSIRPRPCHPEPVRLFLANGVRDLLLPYAFVFAFTPSSRTHPCDRVARPSAHFLIRLRFALCRRPIRPRPCHPEPIPPLLRDGVRDLLLSLHWFAFLCSLGVLRATIVLDQYLTLWYTSLSIVACCLALGQRFLCRPFRLR